MYGCGVVGCAIIFVSVHNVHKHLQLRHTQLMKDEVSKVCVDVYLQNYMKYVHVHSHILTVRILLCLKTLIFFFSIHCSDADGPV